MDRTYYGDRRCPACRAKMTRRCDARFVVDYCPGCRAEWQCRFGSDRWLVRTTPQFSVVEDTPYGR